MAKHHVCEYCASIEWDDIPVVVEDELVLKLSNGATVSGLQRADIRLFSLLANNFPRVATRGFLMDALYGHDPAKDVDDNVVSVLVSRLRKALAQHEASAGQPNGFWVETVRGVGWKLRLGSAVEDAAK